MSKLTLISTPTCPYVQRAVTALKEKGVPFEVVYVDLQNRPEWFVALSPLGKVPVLKVERPGKDDAVVFESAVILEYLEETAEGVKLHPSDPLERAQHRSWMEFGSSFLGDTFKLGAAKDETDLDAARDAARKKLERLETLVVGPYFSGESFSCVDAVFGPGLRQIATLKTQIDLPLLDGLPKVRAWSQALLSRPSVRDAVPANFAEIYLNRLRGMGSQLLKLAA